MATRFYITVEDIEPGSEQEDYQWMLMALFFALKHGKKIQILAGDVWQPIIQFPKNVVSGLTEEKIRTPNDVERSKELEEENFKHETYNEPFESWNSF